jgi:ribosomal-protein-alanine N-acetyltransferase
LYRRFGFAPVGVRRAYYQQPEEDAIVMWAHDVDTDDYAALLDAHVAATPGTTRLEGFATVVSRGGAQAS